MEHPKIQLDNMVMLQIYAHAQTSIMLWMGWRVLQLWPNYKIKDLCRLFLRAQAIGSNAIAQTKQGCPSVITHLIPSYLMSFPSLLKKIKSLV